MDTFEVVHQTLSLLLGITSEISFWLKSDVFYLQINISTITNSSIITIKYAFSFCFIIPPSFKAFGFKGKTSDFSNISINILTK